MSHIDRERLRAALTLEDLAARQFLGLLALFSWATVWAWGCLEVSAADPQDWRLPTAVGVAIGVVLGVAGVGMTRDVAQPFWTRAMRGVVIAMTTSRVRSLVLIAIGAGGATLTYFALIGSIHTVYCNEKDILQWRIVGPERTRTCGTDTLQIWYPLRTPSVSVLDRNDRSLLGYCQPTPRSHIDCLKPKQSGSPPTRDDSELVVAVFRSGDLQFTRAISTTFLERLHRLADDAHRTVRAIQATGPTIPPSEAQGGAEWSHQMDYAVAYAQQARIDYLVAIGTQAALAIKQFDALKKTHARDSSSSGSRIPKEPCS